MPLIEGAGVRDPQAESATTRARRFTPSQCTRCSRVLEGALAFRVPEGDTIHRIAANLGPKLVGKTLERVTTQGLVRNLAGQEVLSVTAHGKHLVIELSNGTYLRAHLGMYGRHRVYPRKEGEAMIAKMSPGRLTMTMTTDNLVALWIGARTIEISDRRAPLHGHAVHSLGPDVLGDEFDPVVAATRAAEAGTRTMADVLLDQRIAAGIGNVYKSEVLFLRGVDPRRRTATVSHAALVEIYETARELMLENLGPGARATRDRIAGDAPGDERYFVYGRSGKPCRRCKTPVECYPLGNPPRWTWSCPRCQPPGGASGDES